MKRIFFTLFFTLLAVSLAGAQSAEALGELRPVPSNIGKFSKRPPKYKSPIVGSYRIKFDAKTEVVDLAGGKKGIAVTIRISKRELVFENFGGQQTARVTIYGRITSKDETTDGFFEERSEVKASVEELVYDPDKTPVSLRKVFELPAGKYQIGLIVRDLFSGMRGVKIVKFEVV